MYSQDMKAVLCDMQKVGAGRSEARGISQWA